MPPKDDNRIANSEYPDPLGEVFCVSALILHHNTMVTLKSGKMGYTKICVSNFALV